MNDLHINGWRIMWVLVAFDLPTTSTQERRRYTIFRNILLEENFLQLQYSVYIKHFPSIEKARAKIKNLGEQTPERGKTSFFLITDKQYGMTKNYYGKYIVEEDKENSKPRQFLLFSDEFP